MQPTRHCSLINIIDFFNTFLDLLDSEVFHSPQNLLRFWKKPKWEASDVDHTNNPIVREELDIGRDEVGAKRMVCQYNRLGFRRFVNLLVQYFGPLDKSIGRSLGLLLRQTFN